MTDRRLIEDSLPLDSIGTASVKEKSGPLGHHGRLHIWWARRPLAACRAAVYSALSIAPSSEEERSAHHELIRGFVPWSAVSPSSKDHRFIAEARDAVSERTRPVVLDPFTGGGAIPLEAQRLGCEAIAHDLNPVAHIIQMASCYYPQAFSDCRGKQDSAELFETGTRPLLAIAVEHWNAVLAGRAAEQLQEVYPATAGQSDIAYVWARTLVCSNPACRASIPLLNQWALSKKSGEYLFPEVAGNSIQVRVRSDEVPAGFDLSAGTISRGNVMCPCCGQITRTKVVRAESRAGRIGETLLAVVSTRDSESGRFYREPTAEDLLAVNAAEQRHAELMKVEVAPGLPAIPDEPLPPVGTLGFRVNNYGFLEWGMLFSKRQLVALNTLSELVAGVTQEVEGMYRPALGDRASEFADAVVTYLGLMVDRAAENMSSLCRWNSTSEKVQGTFGRQALPMVWDYAEVNPFGGSVGDFKGYARNFTAFIERCAEGPPARVIKGSADRLPLEDGSVDAVITDPPYYDAVPYADLSDFFYVWLRRTLRDVHASALQTALAPKRSEMIQNPGANKSKEFFEQSMRAAFGEANRVLKPDGICVVIFAHKSTAAWETMLTGLLDAGFVVTASWPVETENQSRLRAQDSAALASSVFIVCRKRLAHTDGFLDDVEPNLVERLHERLDYFWSQGIRGADFFMSAIGPAVEVFGRHKRVIRLSGEEITIGELLDKVRGIVADYALQRIVHGERAGDVDEASRFYVIWRWAFGTADVDSGEAIHMAQSMGCEFSELISDKGVLSKKGDKVSLRGPLARKKTKGLGEPTATGVHAPLIDVLHRAANLWAAGERQELADFLADSLAPRGHDRMHRLAQSIVDVLVPGDKERALYENFLVGSRSLPAPTKKDSPTANQQKLF